MNEDSVCLRRNPPVSTRRQAEAGILKSAIANRKSFCAFLSSQALSGDLWQKTVSIRVNPPALRSSPSEAGCLKKFVPLCLSGYPEAHLLLENNH